VNVELSSELDVRNMINDGPYYRLCGNEAEIIKGMMQWLRWLYEYWSVFNTRKPCYRREDHTIAVNFDMYKILQWHRAVSLPLHDFFCIYQWQFKGRNYTQYADFHGRGTKPKITAHDQNQKVMVIMNSGYLLVQRSVAIVPSVPAYIH